MASAGHRPGSTVACHAEHAEPGEIDRGGQQRVVSGDPGLATDLGTPAAVAPAHEMADLALDLGPGGLVIAVVGALGLAS
jgi:hypothetical protein